MFSDSLRLELLCFRRSSNQWQGPGPLQGPPNLRGRSCMAMQSDSFGNYFDPVRSFQSTDLLLIFVLSPGFLRPHSICKIRNQLRMSFWIMPTRIRSRLCWSIDKSFICQTTSRFHSALSSKTESPPVLPNLVTVSLLFLKALSLYSQSANMPDESGASQYQVLEELGS